MIKQRGSHKGMKKSIFSLTEYDGKRNKDDDGKGGNIIIYVLCVLVCALCFVYL